jgi:hypothetical protein
MNPVKFMWGFYFINTLNHTFLRDDIKDEYHFIETVKKFLFMSVDIPIFLSAEVFDQKFMLHH